MIRLILLLVSLLASAASEAPVPPATLAEFLRTSIKGKGWTVLAEGTYRNNYSIVLRKDD